MPIEPKDIKTSKVDSEKCEAVEQKILDIFNESKLTFRELIVVLGSLCVDLGGSIAQLESMPSIEDAWRRYAEEPTFPNSLLALGADLLHHWAGFINIPEEK